MPMSRLGPSWVRHFSTPYSPQGSLGVARFRLNVLGPTFFHCNKVPQGAWESAASVSTKCPGSDNFPFLHIAQKGSLGEPGGRPLPIECPGSDNFPFQ